jgi:hypothetical protein
MVVQMTGETPETGMRRLEQDEGHAGPEVTPGPASQFGRSNLRIALVLASIALVFFVGVITSRLLFN